MSNQLLRAAAVAIALAVGLVTPAPCAPAAPVPEVAAPVPPPPFWFTPPAKPLRVSAIHGLWYRAYGIEGALAHTGASLVTDSWSAEKSLRSYPDSYEALMREHLVVLGGVNVTAITPQYGQMLKEYVSRGGALLLICGNFGFNGFHGTALEEIAPVAFAAQEYSAFAPQGLVLKPASAPVEPAIARLNWAAQPRVYWYCNVTPKLGSQTLLRGESKPLLVVGTYGKGRVGVLAASVMGDPPAGHVPFWDWPGWSTTLGGALTWLTQGTASDIAAQEAEFAKIFAAQLLAVDGKSAQEDAVLNRFARVCPGQGAARLLFNTAIRRLEDISPETLDYLMDGAVPHADTGFAELAQQLINSGQTNKAALGLCLLGKSGAETASRTLIRALESGDVDADVMDESLEAAAVKIEDPKERAFIIRRGAALGLAYVGKPDAIPALQAVIKKNFREPARLYDLGIITPGDDLYCTAAIAALRCGDATAAAPAIDALLRMRYAFFTLTSSIEKRIPATDKVGLAGRARALRGIGDVRRHEEQFLAQCTGLPQSVFPAVAKRLAEETEQHASVIALAMLGGQPLPSEAKTVLAGSPVPAVAELGR